MKRIGLIGEAPNDTDAMFNLLNRIYPGRFEFFAMLDHIHGSDLEHQSVKRFLRIEYATKKPDWVIFIRDLDGLEDNQHQIALRKRYFAEFRKVVGHNINRKKSNRNALYLLHVWQIEALIFADPDCFNEEFGTSLQLAEDPMKVRNPKRVLQELKSSRRNYEELDCPVLFNKLDIEKLRKVRYLDRFLRDFERLLEVG